MGLNIVEKYHVKKAMMNTYWSEWGPHLVLFLPQFNHCCLGGKPFLKFLSKTLYLAFLHIMQDIIKKLFLQEWLQKYISDSISAKSGLK